MSKETRSRNLEAGIWKLEFESWNLKAGSRNLEAGSRNNELRIMNNKNKKIIKFTDLSAWQEGHKLALLIYKITAGFPKNEMFGLAVQMRGCAISITSNIAEGFGRHSYKEKVRFYSMSKASVTELQNQLILSRDVNYINNKLFKEVYEQTITVHKILNGLIKTSNGFYRQSDNHNS